MYEQINNTNWWDKIYGYIKPIEVIGYETVKKLERLMKSYLPDRQQTYSENNRKAIYTAEFSINRSIDKPKYTRPYKEKKNMTDLEIIKAEVDGVKEIILQEETTIDNSVSKSEFSQTNTLPIKKLENSNPTAGDSKAKTSLDKLEDFEKNLRSSTINLPPNQLSFFLEKMKKTEHEIKKIRKIMLITIFIFLILFGLLFLLKH